MTEHEIMWIGRQSVTDRQRALPTDEPAFEAALRAICEAAGCAVQRYVAARGEFGSWMLEIERHAQIQRLIWNGRAGRLSLDVPNRGGGWHETSAADLGQADLGAVTEAMRRLLARSGEVE